eukprot:TRINITY_DN13424_c0_g1_i1.p1 TRINITY_DN13424_c0_g1~~TRINITY_DN13424_c0_g1_i1.p1  ORF type:complete len:182 (+),score=10.76 TRINITY_DN13424_c0_g1_i1:678-1223(+)
MEELISFLQFFDECSVECNSYYAEGYPFTSLPKELVIIIISFVDNFLDLFSLKLTCSFLYSMIEWDDSKTNKAITCRPSYIKWSQKYNSSSGHSRTSFYVYISYHYNYHIHRNCNATKFIPYQTSKEWRNKRECGACFYNRAYLVSVYEQSEHGEDESNCYYCKSCRVYTYYNRHVTPLYY